MPSSQNKPIPRATYRLQFTKGFGFSDAARIAPYLARLGVSHVYTSPYLKARPGSTHGYDITDHGELNPELGTSEDFARMLAAFRRHDLGQILDFVPNHMGVGGSDNRWWLDVLEWGPRSPFANWFDIDWQPPWTQLTGKVLVPFLGDQYGVVLASGALKLKFDAEAGSFAVWAYETHKLPISPPHYGRILGSEHNELQRIGDAFAQLSDLGPRIAERAGELKQELAKATRADSTLLAAVQARLDQLNGRPGDFHSWDRLDALIRDQHWRAAWFRVASSEINYRRFFNINDLAAIRMELSEVFDRAHRLVFDLLEEQVIDGIRLDHIDGLFDPKAYCLRLAEKAPRPFYLIAEKILAPHERLRPDWRLDGTTGYEFANLVIRLLIDPTGEPLLTEFYSKFTDISIGFPEIVRICKLQIIEQEMAGELITLARQAGEIARSDSRTVDLTDDVLRRALQQIIACLRVYRTYVDGEASPEDRREIDEAIARAKLCERGLDGSAFDFLHSLLTCDLSRAPQSGYNPSAVIQFVMRFQQYSGPVMAKGLEDTAFYRYNRLLALNEVGGDPSKFTISISAFHEANLERLKHTPHAMVSTSTHDTKRGEDARARLAVLSEIGQDWARHVETWSETLHAGGPGLQGQMPDANDEYFLYQTLVGSWPLELSASSEPAAMKRYRGRVERTMIKAMREARVHTSWAVPDTVYEDAMLSFVRRALDTNRPNPFLESFIPFLQHVARLGMHNSLVQLALKLTVPGVPDIYQGSEFWDLDMVDPDNRRPVDFSQSDAAIGAESSVAELKEHWMDGRIKSSLARRLLNLRRELPNLFREGSYEPLKASGPSSDRIVAFARSHSENAMIIAASLYPSREGPHWEGTIISGPAGLDIGLWRNVLDPSQLIGGSEPFRAERLFVNFPVAILLPEGLRQV